MGTNAGRLAESLGTHARHRWLANLLLFSMVTTFGAMAGFSLDRSVVLFAQADARRANQAFEAFLGDDFEPFLSGIEKQAEKSRKRAIFYAAACAAVLVAHLTRRRLGPPAWARRADLVIALGLPLFVGIVGAVAVWIEQVPAPEVGWAVFGAFLVSLPTGAWFRRQSRPFTEATGDLGLDYFYAPVLLAGGMVASAGVMLLPRSGGARVRVAGKEVGRLLPRVADLADGCGVETKPPGDFEGWLRPKRRWLRLTTSPMDRELREMFDAPSLYLDVRGRPAEIAAFVRRLAQGAGTAGVRPPSASLPLPVAAIMLGAFGLLVAYCGSLARFAGWHRWRFLQWIDLTHAASDGSHTHVDPVLAAAIGRWREWAHACIWLAAAALVGAALVAWRSRTPGPWRDSVRWGLSAVGLFAVAAVLFSGDPPVSYRLLGVGTVVGALVAATRRPRPA